MCLIFKPKKLYNFKILPEVQRLWEVKRLRVVVPLDFSKEAEKAYGFAKKQGWEVIVLHVLEEGLLESIYPFFSIPSLDFKKFVERGEERAGGKRV